MILLKGLYRWLYRLTLSTCPYCSKGKLYPEKTPDVVGSKVGKCDKCGHLHLFKIK